jgi:VanZ family protein
VTSERGARAGPRSDRGDRWLVVWAVFTAILLLMPPVFGSVAGSGRDKAGHFFLFLVLAALAVGPAQVRTRHPVLVAVLGGVVFGAVLELLQSALGWRSGELADLMADGLGSLAGAVLPKLWGRA